MPEGEGVRGGAWEGEEGVMNVVQEGATSRDGEGASGGVPEGEEGAMNVPLDIGIAPEGAVTNGGVCNGQEDAMNIEPDAMNVARDERATGGQLCNGEGAMNVPGNVPEGECVRGWSRKKREEDTMNVALAIGSALEGERTREGACQGEGTMNIDGSM